MIPITNFTGRLGNQMFEYAYMYTQMRDGLIPDIYVQDPQYFRRYSDDIKKLFGDGIGYLPYVSLHIRRGDYVGNSFHTDLTETDYYERAIALFPDRQFLIFSDDTDWCKEHFSDTDKFQVMSGSEIEDFNMMASCKDNIIANSSYSWWAAYINPNWAKQVICPKESSWFRDGEIRCKVPSTWTQI